MISQSTTSTLPRPETSNDASFGHCRHPRVSLIICTLDEHEAIGGVLDEMRAELAGVAHEIIVVDDSADDLTAMVVKAHMRADPSVRLIRREGRGGLASAAIAGWDAARGRSLAIMDGDGQHDPRLIARLLRRMDDSDADVVVASRYLDSAESGLCGPRHLISRGGVMLSGLLLGLRLADPMSGCFLMRRAWYETVRPDLSGLGFKILIDVVASGRRRPLVEQIPTVLRARAGGESKLDLRVAVDLITLLVEKRTGGAIPARMSQFLLVGATGLAAHMAVLSLAALADLPFWAAQTLRHPGGDELELRAQQQPDLPRPPKLTRPCPVAWPAELLRRLPGRSLGQRSRRRGAWPPPARPGSLAGAAGAVLGAFWNYQAARRLTWRTSSQDVQGRAACRQAHRPVFVWRMNRSSITAWVSAWIGADSGCWSVSSS
jgi:dolichol-phosphate mannosyltransferase